MPALHQVHIPLRAPNIPILTPPQVSNQVTPTDARPSYPLLPTCCSAGTHVAGIIGAAANNNIGVAGMGGLLNITVSVA